MTDGVKSFDEIVRLYEAGELTIADVRARYGHVVVRNLLLAKYATERESSWPRVDYPPKMFISHKWRNDDTACHEAYQLAEALATPGVEVVFDKWWSNEQNQDPEWRISQLAISRTVFFLLTPEYFAHTSVAENAGKFRATWVEDESHFVHNLYRKQLDENPGIGAVINPTGLLLDPDRTPTPWFNCLFDVRTPERWQAFLDSFAGLRVQTLSHADQQMIKKEATAHAIAFMSGQHGDAFHSLAMLASRFPFVGDLAVMLVKMAREVGDLDRARDVALVGAQSTENWRWEHRWLQAQWESLRPSGTRDTLRRNL